MRGIYSIKTYRCSVILVVLLMFMNVNLLAGQENAQINRANVIKNYKSSHSHFIKGEKHFRKGKYESSETELKKFIVNVGDEKNIFYENTYVVFDVQRRDALIIDPGIPDKRIENFISERKLKIKKILNTHGHFDHVGANDHYADLFKVEVLAHEADRPLYERSKNEPDEFFSKEGSLDIEGLQVSVIHTPGHTPGSVCFLINGMLITGDTLLKKSIGRTQGKTPLEEIEKMNKEVEHIKSKLFVLPESTGVFPGHGLATSIGDERRDNPFLVKASVIEILKRQFGSHPDIAKIEQLTNDPDDFDVLVRFRSAPSLEKFKVSYGQLFLGLRLRLIVESE